MEMLNPVRLTVNPNHHKGKAKKVRQTQRSLDKSRKGLNCSLPETRDQSPKNCRMSSGDWISRTLTLKIAWTASPHPFKLIFPLRH